jgi:hypothetical protein
MGHTTNQLQLVNRLLHLVVILEGLKFNIPRLCVRLPAILTHRIATHLDPVGIVNQPVENAIGHRRVADLLVPAGNRQLRRENQRADLVTVFADLPEVAALCDRSY